MSIVEKITRAKTDYDEVYEAGKKSEYDTFWDEYQQYGKRTNYVTAFAGGRDSVIRADVWNDNNFKPKYDIILQTSTFNRCSVTNLKQKLIDCGVKISDNAAILYYSFFASSITHIPDISTTAVTNIQNAFNGCHGLVSIDGITIDETCEMAAAFNSCIKLTNIKVYGTFGKNISFSQSPLNVESAKSVINALKNYAGTGKEYTYKLTLKSTVWDALNEAETPPSGETWQEYVETLGWTYA